MQIRPAEIDDAPELARVHVGTWRAAYRGIVPDAVLDGLSVETREAGWREGIAAGRTATFVCIAEGRLAGFATVGPGRDEDAPPPRTGELYAIYLDPRDWGTGLGHALWTAALDELARLGFSEAVVWVFEANTRARAFYERVGFRLEPGTRKMWEHGDARAPEVRYRRPVP